MPQLNAYIPRELLDALDARVAELSRQPGTRASRSSVTAAALRAFFSSFCPVENTKESLIGNPRHSS